MRNMPTTTLDIFRLSIYAHNLLIFGNLYCSKYDMAYIYTYMSLWP